MMPSSGHSCSIGCCLGCFRFKLMNSNMIVCFLILMPLEAANQPTRLKDLVSIEGVRDNQLVGYGIVVGLKGTGDSRQTTFPIQTLAATLLRMGVSVPASSIRVQNLAAVFVSA